MRLGAVIFSWLFVGAALAGELRGSVLRADNTAPEPAQQEAPRTPPTAWEIPLPLVPVSMPPPKRPSKSETAESLLVLIPKQPGKRPKPPQIVLNDAKTKPNPAFTALQDTVTFVSKQELTLSFTDEKPLLVPKKKKVTKAFTKEGVYRYTAKESPGLRGLIIVGTGARTQSVEGSFRVKNLEDGAWSVYLVTAADIVYAGEVSTSEQKEATIEIELP